MKKKVTVIISLSYFFLIFALTMFFREKESESSPLMVTSTEETIIESVSTTVETSSDNFETDLTNQIIENSSERAENSHERTEESTLAVVFSETVTKAYRQIEKEAEGLSERAEGMTEKTTEFGITDTVSVSTEGNGTGNADDSPEETSSAAAMETGQVSDRWEDYAYYCNENDFSFIINSLSDPEWYDGDDLTTDCYNRVFHLSTRYRQEHPYTAGSILKPFFQNVKYVFPFSSDYGERKVVVKAYDTLMNKKYFRIHFTVTDKYELDTVTVEELSDDDIAE